SLKTLPVQIMEGLIFTTFAKDPLDLGAAADALARSAGVHGWATAKVAHRELYAIRSNWKLAIENYMECYHCTPAHPEFSKLHVLARPAELNVESERARSTRHRGARHRPIWMHVPHRPGIRRRHAQRPSRRHCQRHGRWPIGRALDG